MIDLIKKQQSVWESLKNSGKPVVLYGMGDGADKVLKAFEKFNIQTAGVMASDEFVRGQSFHGFKVKKLSELEAELGDFTVALCFASQLPDVMAAIKNVAQRHKTLVPSVPVFGDILFDAYSLAVCMWGIAIPAALLGAFVFHWPVPLVFACTCLDEIGKLPWVYAHYKKYKWVRDLTRQRT